MMEWCNQVAVVTGGAPAPAEQRGGSWRSGAPRGAETNLCMPMRPRWWSRRIVSRGLEAERGDRTDTRHGHEPADLRIITCQLQHLTIEVTDLLLDSTHMP